jgi:hypothetical protein
MTETFTGGVSVGGASRFRDGIFVITVNIAIATRMMTTFGAFRRSHP